MKNLTTNWKKEQGEWQKAPSTFRQGFTLLEVLLVIVFLFFLSYVVYISVKKTTEDKVRVETKSEVLQEFRSAFGILERDLRSTYFVTAEDFGWNPREEKDPATRVRLENQDPTPAVKPVPITLFQGKENSLFFSTRTHQRLSANAPENEEHFVFYDLKDNALLRSESKRAIRKEDRENPQDFRSFVLIDKVVSLKFGFWNSKQQRWVPDWDSEKAEFLNQVPQAVKIEIRFTPEVVSEEAKKSQELFLQTAIRLPEAWYRNIKWTKAAPAGSGQPDGGED